MFYYILAFETWPGMLLISIDTPWSHCYSLDILFTRDFTTSLEADLDFMHKSRIFVCFQSLDNAVDTAIEPTSRISWQHFHRLAQNKLWNAIKYSRSDDIYTHQPNLWLLTGKNVLLFVMKEYFVHSSDKSRSI